MNNDGNPAVTVTDVVYLIDFIYRYGPAPACEDEGDVNDDNIVADFNDLLFIIDWIFRGGPAPGACP